MKAVEEKPDMKIRLEMDLSDAEELLSLLAVGRQVYSTEALQYADILVSVLEVAIRRGRKQEEFYVRL